VFAYRLKQLRENRGLKQCHVAKALYVTDRTMSNYECGRYIPNVEFLVAIANYFDVTVDWLLGRDKL